MRFRTFTKTLTKSLFNLFLLLACSTGILVIAVNLSPAPFAWLVKTQFSKGIGDPSIKPPIYADLRRNVQVQKDIEYVSRFGNNRLDVFTPKERPSPLPTILWVHGGGFVGGDKRDIETWATLMAGRGYTVISMNYELAPANTYPGPLIQVGEVYEFLKQQAARFPTVDLQQLVIGGDSAGAQIASQFIALQTHPSLAETMGLKVQIPKQHLLGAILYCGPYDLAGLYDGDKWFARFFVRQMGWAYFGIKEWKNASAAAQATTMHHITADYPSTFLTDGNTASFEGDAKKLEAALKTAGVYTESLYFPLTQGKLGHEYQFDFAVPEAMAAYKRTLEFLDKIQNTRRFLSNPETESGSTQ